MRNPAGDSGQYFGAISLILDDKGEYFREL
jgi:hypothetical protein